LSYFGTDQSQVQRYLTTPSIDEARRSLLMSAYWKIPLQALVLLVGVLVFVYYVFTAPPLLYNPSHEARVRAAEPALYDSLGARYSEQLAARAAAARALTDAPRGSDVAAASATAFAASDSSVQAVRTEALAAAARVTGEPSRDVNYVIVNFVLNQLPLGMAGLFIAAVMAAAMSSIAAELNSLATATIVDFYKRWYRREGTDAHYLTVSKAATFIWGLLACGVATYAVSLGSLIEVVNRFGSFFYGSILGVFLLAMNPRARGTPAFIGLIAGMTVVGTVAFGAPSVSFLWHNVIGATTVFVVGSVLSLTEGARTG
jgi:Na+/proline symporter